MFLNEEDNNPLPPLKIPRFVTVVIAGFLFAIIDACSSRVIYHVSSN